MAEHKRILCIDFDGVIHSYTSGWQGADVIADPPVPGALDWLESLIVDGFEVCIYSSRSKEPGGPEAMRAWLEDWCDDDDQGLGRLGELSYPTEKPAAYLTIDDRAICFQGTFPTTTEIKAFTPWHCREFGAGVRGES